MRWRGCIKRLNANEGRFCTTIGLPFSSLRGTIIKSNSVSTTNAGNKETWQQKNVKRQHGAQHRAKNAQNSGSRQGLAPCLQAFCWWCWPLWREIRHGRPCTMCCSDFLAVAALCWARQCAALLCSIPGAKTFCPRSSSWFLGCLFQNRCQVGVSKGCHSKNKALVNSSFCHFLQGFLWRPRNRHFFLSC